jgi:hypothetical protein
MCDDDDDEVSVVPVHDIQQNDIDEPLRVLVNDNSNDYLFESIRF